MDHRHDEWVVLMPTLWKSHTFTVLLAAPGESDVAMLTYVGDVSRVRIDQAVAATVGGSPVPAGATRVVERSTDLIHWTTVRGGDEAPVSATAPRLDDCEFTSNVQNHYRIRVYVSGLLFHTFNDAITVVLDEVWLKSPARPFLNRVVHVMGFGDISKPDRGSVHDIIGRSLPVALTDVRGSRQLDLQLLAPDREQAETLDLILASGDVLLVHVPDGVNMPGGYYYVRPTKEHRWPTAYSDGSEPRTFTLPLTAVAAPPASIHGALMTWRGLANRYATWADVIEANAQWRDLLELIGDPGDVIVP